MELALVSLLAVAFLVGFVMGNISRPVPTNLGEALKKTFNIKEKTTITSPSQRRASQHILNDIEEE